MRDREDRRGLTALVTGASGGLGLEFARLLAADGCHLVLVARNEAKLQALAGELATRHGIRAAVLAADLSIPSAPSEIESWLEARGVQVEVLINNAGVGLLGPVATNSLERELAMIRLNITSLYELTRRLLPGMVSRRRGRILNVASTAAFQPGPLMAVYYASKAFVVSFSEALGNELRGSGVSVTTLCPGPTRTGWQAGAGLDSSGRAYQRSMATATAVARAGYEAMWRGHGVVIPGFRNKLLAQAVRLVPRGWTMAVVRRMHERVRPVNHRNRHSP